MNIDRIATKFTDDEFLEFWRDAVTVQNWLIKHYDFINASHRRFDVIIIAHRDRVAQYNNMDEDWQSIINLLGWVHYII